MHKFTPLDLQPHANAGREPEGWHPAIAAELASLPAGKQAFWGIPFELLPAAGEA